MLSRRLAVFTGSALVALSVTPVAEARVAADAAAAKKPRLASMRSAPARVEVGERVRVRGRAVNLRKKTTKLTFTLRKSSRFVHLRTVKLRRPKQGRARSFSVRLRIPDLARAGDYRLRACLQRRGKDSCRSKALKVTDKPGPGPGPGPGPNPPGGLPAEHSLRPPLTGENFYFVMADRFFNGDTEQRQGRHRLRRPRGPRLRRDAQGLLPRRRPQRPAVEDRLHQGPGDDRDLADPELQEPAGAGQQRLPVRRLPRLLGHRLHADRPALRDQRGAARPDRASRTTAGSRSSSTSSPTTPRTSSRTRSPASRTSRRTSSRSAPPRAPRSTTATTRAACSRRSTARPASPTRRSTRRTCRRRRRG